MSLYSPLKNEYPRVYRIWMNMRNRCRYSNDGTKYWNGKGIKVFDLWDKSFGAFLEWSLINGYKDNLSIDRINPDDGYNPVNCRWVDRSTQAQNMKMPIGRTGYRGVRQDGKRFRARITIDKKQIIIGGFDTAKDAAIAYDEYIESNKLNHITNRKLGLL